MTSLIRTQWSPSQDLRQFQTQMNRLFEPFFGRPNGGVNSENEELVTGSWIPAVDVSEDADRILVRAEIPGMKQEDIEIQFHDGMLTIRGDREFDRSKSERNYHRIERAYGTFVRSFSLPRGVNADQISATYESGILEVVVPKKEEAKPKQIRIQVGQSQQGSKKATD